MGPLKFAEWLHVPDPLDPTKSGSTVKSKRQLSAVGAGCASISGKAPLAERRRR